MFGTIKSIICLHSVPFADTITLLHPVFDTEQVGEKRRERGSDSLLDVDMARDFNLL